MNYNMQGMTKTIPELFVMLKSTKVEIKKEHQVLMIDKTTSFKKKGKWKKGNFKKNGKQVATPGKKPKFVKEICPRGNNKVIIYFLISW